MAMQATLKLHVLAVSNSSCQRGYFLHPENIMTFFVELKGRFPVYSRRIMTLFIFTDSIHISLAFFPLFYVPRITLRLMLFLVLFFCLQKHLQV